MIWIDSFKRPSWEEDAELKGLLPCGYALPKVTQNPSTKKVIILKDCLNALNYIFGPIIGLIRLIAAAVLAYQLHQYKQNNDLKDVKYLFCDSKCNESWKGDKALYYYAGRKAGRFIENMIKRACLELSGLGYLLTPLLDFGNTKCNHGGAIPPNPN